MNAYSQTYGSFIRTGNYPLEADYIFRTEEELVEFYQNDIEQTRLHQGLLKIVGEGESQSLYWVVKEGSELVYKKLIDSVDRNSIYTQLEELSQKLEQEINDREESDNEIWGDKDNIPEELNSIKKISEAIDIEKRKLEKLHNEFNSAIGVSDRDIIEYLKTLPYKSITEISIALDQFLNKTNSEDSSIDTLVELKNFLSGVSDQETLLGLLTSLYNNIEGTPLPSEKMRTLRGLEDELVLLGQISKGRLNNLQIELDHTQSGIGLNQDGSFSPDMSTNFLTECTSIVSCLRELDRLLKVALEDCNISVENTDTIHLNITKEESGVKLSGNIRINSSPENQIVSNSGLYHHTELEYSQGILTLKVNGNTINTIPIGLSAIVHDSYYNPLNEELVIEFILLNGDTQIVKIPVGSLIREWGIDNSIPGKVVELTKEEVLGPGPDKLSADVRISSQPDNILQKDDNTLYVSKNSVLQDVSKSLDTLKEEIILKIEREADRAKAEESSIRGALTAETERATSVENMLKTMIEQVNLGAISQQLEDLSARIRNLEIKTSW